MNDAQLIELVMKKDYSAILEYVASQREHIRKLELSCTALAKGWKDAQKINNELKEAMMGIANPIDGS